MHHTAHRRCCQDKSITRRAILAGAVTLPALSLPAIAAPDPVFAAIEKSRVTWERYGDALKTHDPDWDSQICVDAQDTVD